MRRMNISIDDISPHSLSGVGVLDRCFEILAVHPDVKFTLFVPTAYWRTVYIPGRVDTRTDAPLYIYEHPAFCDVLQQLPKANFEVGFHGRYHGIPGYSNNDEMRYMLLQDTTATMELVNNEFVVIYDGNISPKIEDTNTTNILNMCKRVEIFSKFVLNMRNDVEKANLTHVFKNILRPPAMYMNSEVVPAAANEFSCLALSPRRLHTSGYGDISYLKNIVYANVWIPDDDLSVATGDIELLYHACEWDGGYLNEKRTQELMTFLDTHQGELEYSFMEEMI